MILMINNSMRIINLDKDFKPFGEGMFFKKFDFPSGCEPHIKLMESPSNHVRITTRIQSSNDVILILLTVDALRRYGAVNIELFIPYLPFARQDRVMVEGEPLSVKVMANLLNSCEFSRVISYDLHSDVSLALINNSESISNHYFVKEVLKNENEYLIVSPDAGAYKKIFNTCQAIGYTKEIVLCNKVRDVSTGRIKQITIDNTNIEGKNLYIVDDIADGANTFNFLSKELKAKACKTVNLIVSHGIFSQGYDELKKNIDSVYTTDSFKDITDPYVTQIKLENLLND